MLREGVNFCSNCGSCVEVNNDIEVNNNLDINKNENLNNKNSNNNKEKDFGLYTLICGICSIIFSGIIGLILGIISINLDKKEITKTAKGKIGKILGIIGIILSILFLLSDFFKFFSDKSEVNYGEQENIQDDNVVTNRVKGNYSREIFSGHSFDYQTLNDKAVFTFKNDSTFEVNYVDGATYKGIYEVYNGFYITVKAEDIKEDKTIDKNESLAKDISNVANKMMASNLLNTYLLWIKTDDGILQPFMVSYNEDTKSGDIVNVYAQTQGKLYLK